MIHQKEVLEWLKGFNFDQIKEIITIKNNNNIHLIKSILHYKPDCKPIDYITHGYCKNQIQNDSTIYVREKFRYKNKKESKKKMDQLLCENITAARNNPYAFSVRKSFIKNGQLSECMLLLSEDQIFNYTNANYRESVWFNEKNINSFSQWVIHLFELEIFEAYYNHYSSPEVNRLEYLEKVITKDQIVEEIKNIVYSHNNDKFMVNSKEYREEEGANLSIKVEEREYLLVKCMQKIEMGEEKDREISEIILQYEWLTDDPNNKINLIYAELSFVYHHKYDNYKIDLKIKEIQQLNLNKKRKKKTKKNNNNKKAGNNEQEQKGEGQNMGQNNGKEVNNGNISRSKSQDKKQDQQIHQKETNQDSQLLNNQKKGQEILELEQIKEEDTKQMKFKQAQRQRQLKLKERQRQLKQIQWQRQLKQKQKKVLQAKLKETELKKGKIKENKQQQQLKKSKKLTQEKINQYISTYYQQLTQQSSQQQKYRQICLEIIQNTIQELHIPSNWKLQLFGSVSINFALKQSDLDLVLNIEKEGCCLLSDIYDIFNTKQWVRSCNIIKEARVPIVQFQIVLADVRHAKIKQSKRLSKHVIHVDISIFSGSESHQGMNNTIFLKEIFDSHEPLMVSTLIFKQLLRIYKLNKPYKGGIGSYSLVILVYNILKMKNIEIDGNYMRQILSIINFLTKDFEPYITLITPFKHSKLIPNPELILNIEDPHEHVLLNTNTRLISQIQDILQQFREILTSIEEEMMKINIEERKKMKRVFFQNWNTLFKAEEEEQGRKQSV